jgi:LmbE family N-acetylglucosaminyl deacetylase
MGNCKRELGGRVLVLVAHADDESVCYGALLPRMREAVVVIATDGAPRDEYFWRRFGSREAYRAVRRDEARAAMRLAGVRELVLLAEEDGRLEDQRLFLNLAAAHEQLEKLVERVRPEAIATLAYEGGHPDHDSCSVLAARLGRQFGVPVWEAPAYFRENARAKRDDTASVDPTFSNKGRMGATRHSTVAGGGQIRAGEIRDTQDCLATTEGCEGELRLQQFICETGDEVAVEIGDQELELKCAMCAQYVSQGDFLQKFNARREIVRPQVNYDYGRPPHEGKTNYEQWQWWMSAQEVCAKFEEFLESER